MQGSGKFTNFVPILVEGDENSAILEYLCLLLMSTSTLFCKILSIWLFKKVFINP